MLSYDNHGLCTQCRLPGSGFVSDGVCMCGDLDDDIPMQPSTDPRPVCSWCWLPLSPWDGRRPMHADCEAECMAESTRDVA